MLLDAGLVSPTDTRIVRIISPWFWLTEDLAVVVPTQTKGSPRAAGSPSSVLLRTVVSVVRTVAVVWVFLPIIAIVAVIPLISLEIGVVIVTIVAHLAIV
jgi:hypothetical protein